jgi:hypothetical protein
MVLNSDGTLNTTCNVTTNNISEGMKIDQDGNILVRANSDGVYGQLIKLNPNLTYNNSWMKSSTQTSTCFELVEGSTNRLYIGFIYGSDPRGSSIHQIYSYNYITGDYVSQSLTFNRPIRAIQALSDGRLLVVGEFTTYNGQSTRQIVVLNSDFTVNTLFPNGFSSNSPNSDGVAAEILLQSDGKILIAGRGSLYRDYTPSGLDYMPPFQYFNGQSNNSIVRLNADFTRDSSFIVGSGFELTGSINPYLNNYASVFTLATQSFEGDTSIIYGGYIQEYNNSVIGYIVSTDMNGTKNSLSN